VAVTPRFKYPQSWLDNAEAISETAVNIFANKCKARTDKFVATFQNLFVGANICEVHWMIFQEV
jgi:hypothetical protein